MPDTPPIANPQEPPAILRELPDEILGSRVLLRPYRPGDGVALWEAVEESREHIRPWLPWGDTHQSAAESEALVRKSQAHWLLRDDLPMGIWRREDGRFLGGTGLHRIRWEIPYFEIGYWLRRTEEGKGYMTEAVALLCRLCFEQLAANRVEIQCNALNQRSASVPRRLGFTHEATLRNYRRDTSGELCDFMFFALTPQDYVRQTEQGKF